MGGGGLQEVVAHEGSTVFSRGGSMGLVSWGPVRFLLRITIMCTENSFFKINRPSHPLQNYLLYLKV